MLSMNKVSKTIWSYNSISVAKISLPGWYKFRRVVSIVALDVNDGGTPYKGIFSGTTRPYRKQTVVQGLVI